jgi:hypothetical protein
MQPITIFTLVFFYLQSLKIATLSVMLRRFPVMSALYCHDTGTANAYAVE